MNEATRTIRSYGPSIWAKEALLHLARFAEESNVIATLNNEVASVCEGRFQHHVGVPITSDELEMQSIGWVSERKIAPAMAALSTHLKDAIQTWHLVLPKTYPFCARESFKGFSLRCIGATDQYEMAEFADENPALVLRFDILWAPQ